MFLIQLPTFKNWALPKITGKYFNYVSHSLVSTVAPPSLLGSGNSAGRDPDIGSQIQCATHYRLIFGTSVGYVAILLNIRTKPCFLSFYYSGF